MKNIIPLLLISIILIGCSQEVKRYHIDEVLIHDEVISKNDTLTFLKKDMSLLNGSVYCEFGEVGTFINGKKYGLHREYFSNGQLWLEETYKDTKLKVGDDSGNTKYCFPSSTTYNLRLIGTQKFWYRNGQLKYETNIKNGFENGRSRVWYENGQLKEEYHKKNGKSIGISRGWKEDGQLSWETKHEIIDGCPEQIWFKSYDSNGNFTIDYIYKDTTKYIMKDGKMIPIH
jgi:hypothetical protein